MSMMLIRALGISFRMARSIRSSRPYWAISTLSMPISTTMRTEDRLEA